MWEYGRVPLLFVMAFSRNIYDFFIGAALSYLLKSSITRRGFVAFGGVFYGYKRLGTIHWGNPGGLKGSSISLSRNATGSR